MSGPNQNRPSKLTNMGSTFSKLLVVVGVILFALEFFIHRHGVNGVEEVFMFPAIYGFLAFLLIVQVGKWLRLAIMRREDYYDE
jgi:hypothetical protein